LHYGSQNTEFLGRKINIQIVVKNTLFLCDFLIVV